MPEITATTCTSEGLFEENADLLERNEALQCRNIDLLERILSIREIAEAATDLASFKAAVLSECLRATDYTAWLAAQR